MSPVSLFDQWPHEGNTEHFLTLLQRKGLRIERIVSRGQASPPDFWYDQEEDEWVLLLQGQATLEFEGGEKLALRLGDYCLIPSRTRHRVEAVSLDALWLAVHFAEPEGAERTEGTKRVLAGSR